MGKRASGSTFYNPEDSNNSVTFKARCGFLKLVLDNDPVLANRVSKDVFPLFFGVRPDAHTDTMKLGNLDIIIRLFKLYQAAGTVMEFEAKTLLLPGRRELHDENGCQLPVEINIPHTVRTLVSVYYETCLWRLGHWTLEFLIKFAIYWNQQPAHGCLNLTLVELGSIEPDGTVRLTLPHPAVSFSPPALEPYQHGVILELQPPASPLRMLEIEKASVQPPYSLQTLPWRDYTRLYGDTLSEEERKRPMKPLPLWFYDASTGGYYVPMFGIEEYNPKELGLLLKEAHDDSRTHYLKRLELWAKENGLKSFQGHRTRDISPEERYY